MRRRPSTLAIGAAAATIGLFIGASAGQLMAEAGNHPQSVNLLAGPAPEAAVAVPGPTLNLDGVARKAVAETERKGADVSFSLLDRRTGQLVSAGDSAPLPIASVVKLFIADDLLMQATTKNAALSPQDRHAIEVMLQSSDDYAADDFWTRDGGKAIINRIVKRYGLTKTTAPYDGNWWNTMSTTNDLVRYYAKLLDGSGGLAPEAAGLIVSNLAASKPVGIDGYPQRFGIPEGLFAEPVAVKQGWMCCWNGNAWLHMSTGLVGSDRRYVIAIGSMQPVDDVTARNTVTETLKKIFPDGHI